MAIRVITHDSASDMRKSLELIGHDSKIISIYGLNGKHWAWVEVPEPQKELNLSTKKKGNK